MRTVIAKVMVIVLIAIIVFLVVSFVGKRDEYGYIGPDKGSQSYQYLMSGLSSWSDYTSGKSLTDLSQTQQYFKRAIDQNRDTTLGTVLAKNVSRIDERSKLIVISECLNAVRTIGATRDEIDTSYNNLFALLEDQIILVPTVLSSIRNVSTIKCVKTYVDHLSTTSIKLADISRTRSTQKDAYAEIINDYPRNLGSCDQIMTIQAQSAQLKQDLADMTYQYEQYREILQDPSRHQKFCNEQYNTTLKQDIQKLTRPALQQINTSVKDAIQKVKDSMNTSNTTSNTTTGINSDTGTIISD